MPDTLARRVALERKIQYADLDIPSDAKRQIHYVREDEYVMNKDVTDFELLDTFPEYRKSWGLVREFHMHKTFFNESGSHSQKLLICGHKHVTGLSRLLADTHYIQDITPIYKVKLPTQS